MLRCSLLRVIDRGWSHFFPEYDSAGRVSYYCCGHIPSNAFFFARSVRVRSMLRELLSRSLLAVCAESRTLCFCVFHGLPRAVLLPFSHAVRFYFIIDC